MQLKVKVVGPLSRYLPAGSVDNQTVIDAAEGATVADLIKALGMPEDQKCIVSIDDEVVPTGERQSKLLSASDSIKLISPLKGG